MGNASGLIEGARGRNLPRVDVIGNTALQRIEVEGADGVIQHVDILGGSALQVAYPLLFFGIPSRLIANTGSDERWGDELDWLDSKGVDTSVVRYLRNEVLRDVDDVRFYLKYNKSLDLVEFAARNSGLQGLAVAAFLGLVSSEEKERALTFSPVVHICPLPIEQQLLLVRQARDRDQNVVISLQTHSSLLTGHPEELLGILPEIDLFFINRKEVFMLAGIEDRGQAVTDVGTSLSSKMQRPGALFLTMAEHGVEIFQQGQYLGHISAPKFDRGQQIQDPTGAGDAFAGGALAGYLLTRDLGIAAQLGSYMAGLALTGFGLQGVREAILLKNGGVGSGRIFLNDNAPQSAPNRI